MTSRQVWLSLLDILFSLLYVGPLTVLFWRGTFVSLYTFFVSGLVKLIRSPRTQPILFPPRISRLGPMEAVSHPLQPRAPRQDPPGPHQTEAGGDGGWPEPWSTNLVEGRGDLPGLPVLRGDVGGRVLLSLLGLPVRTLVRTSACLPLLLHRSDRLQGLLLHCGDTSRCHPGIALYQQG